MQNSTDNSQGLVAAIEKLSTQLQSSVAQQQRLEKRLRFMSFGVAMLLTIGLAAGGGFLLGHSNNAHAQFGQAIERDVQGAERNVKQEFDKMMSSLRSETASMSKFDPGKAIAVILHDMQKALQAVPEMAKDMDTMAKVMVDMNGKMDAMPAMANSMSQMNWKMGVIAHDIDNTMGRMGRMMPW